MQAALLLSVALHLVLILLAIFGLPHRDRPAEPAASVQVSLISAADLPEVSALPVPPVPTPAPTPAPRSAAVAPEAVAPDPGPVPDVPTTPPPPVDRVAPVPQPRSDLPAGTTLVPPVAQQPTPTPVPTPEPPEPQAPEEAAPEIVTEAVETREEAAPVAPTAPRPAPRPNRPAPTPPAPTPEPTPEPVPTPDPAPTPDPMPEPTPAPEPTPTPEPEDPEPVDPIAAAVAAAVAEAQNTPAQNTPAQSGAPSGPPLTGEERDALRLAVSSCWNFSALSTEAARVTVVVGMDMAPDGKPLADSLRLISSSGGSDAAAAQAFEVARRAILRCQRTGYDLPRDKYDQWQQIEMTFNPERMRQR